MTVSAINTLEAACDALLAGIRAELPGMTGMSDVQVYEEEPDQLPPDGIWLDGARGQEVASTSRGAGLPGRTERAECDVVIWVSRDGEGGGVRSRALAIRSALRAIVRADEFLGGAANLWSEPTEFTLALGVSPSGGSRCALITQIVHLEIRS